MSDEPKQPIGRRERPALTVWVYPLVAVFVWGAGIVLVLHFFGAFKFVFLTALFAGSLAAALQPVRKKIPGPRWLAGTLTGLVPIAIGLAIFYLIGVLIAGPISDEMKQWPVMKQNLNDLLARLSTWLHLSQVVTVDDLLQRLSQYVSAAGSAVAGAASAVLTVAVILITVGIGSLYMQAESPTRLVSPVVAMLPLEWRASFERAVNALVPRLRWWLIGTIIDIVVIGGVSWVFFWLGGLPLAVPVAVLVGLSEMVPTIGPAVAFAIALLIAASLGTTQVVAVLAAYLGVQLVEWYVLLPLVMERTVKVPPVITLFTILLWGGVFGIPGLLLALPINLLLWGFMEHLLMRRHEQASKRPA